MQHIKQVFGLGVFMIFGLTFGLVAQSQPDMQLIRTTKFDQSRFYNKRQVTFGLEKNRSAIQKYNPLNLVFSGLMYTYQRWISPQISADCLYHPTCSSYSKALFHEYGFFRGLVFSSDRIMRCDRISATTIKPISINPQDGRVHEEPGRYRLRDQKKSSEVHLHDE